MHNFANSLKIGKAGEAALNRLWPELVPTDGRKGDFKLGKDTVEVKTDSYDMDKTVNFFIERWSDIANQKPGGPWQSLEHGAKYFVYWFPKNGTAFVFETLELVTYLNTVLADYQSITIPNRAWVTVGYKIPRETLKSLAIIKEFT